MTRSILAVLILFAGTQVATAQPDITRPTLIDTVISGQPLAAEVGNGESTALVPIGCAPTLFAGAPAANSGNGLIERVSTSGAGYALEPPLNIGALPGLGQALVAGRLSDNRIVLASGHPTDSGGSVQLFEWIEPTGQWSLFQTIAFDHSGGNGPPATRFGHAIELDEDFLAIGAPGDSTAGAAGNLRGAFSMFQYNPATQLFEALARREGWSDNVQLGWSVDVSRYFAGDVEILIYAAGAPGDGLSKGGVAGGGLFYRVFRGGLFNEILDGQSFNDNNFFLNPGDACGTTVEIVRADLSSNVFILTGCQGGNAVEVVDFSVSPTRFLTFRDIDLACPQEPPPAPETICFNEDMAMERVELADQDVVMLSVPLLEEVRIARFDEQADRWRIDDSSIITPTSPPVPNFATAISVLGNLAAVTAPEGFGQPASHYLYQWGGTPSSCLPLMFIDSFEN